MKFHMNHVIRKFRKGSLSNYMNGTEVISCERKVTKKLFQWWQFWQWLL